MKIVMTNVWENPDGSQFGETQTTDHGWTDIKRALKHIWTAYGDRIVRLPNGYVDREINPATGVRQRVTLTEIAG